MIWRILIIILLIFMFVGTTMNKESITPEQIDNVTEKMSYDNLNVSVNFQEMGNNKNNTFLVRTIGKFADLYGFFMVEGAKVALNFGYNNPQYNVGLMWKLMFISIFAICIVPLIYLVLFIGYGIYVIVIWIRRLIENVQSKKRNKT